MGLRRCGRGLPPLPTDRSSGQPSYVARRQPAPKDTKNRLMAAAVEVFGTRGYAKASVDDIVKRAGMTRGAFYYYFTSKADIAHDLQAPGLTTR